MDFPGPPPPGIDLSQDRSANLIGAWSSTWGMAVIAVILRVSCRKLVKVRLWLDDWLIIISLLFSGGFMFTVSIYMVNNGFCKHIWAGPPEAGRDWALGLFTTEFTYTVALCLVKLSIITFYWRIFIIRLVDKIILGILAGMVICWGMITSVLQCIPISALWNQFDPINPPDPSTFECSVKVHPFFIGKAVPHIATDILILIFPLPYIWNLRLRLSQKIATSFIFGLGIFVTAVSITRLVFVLELDLNSPDVTWNECTEMIWTGVETYVGTVCACLPSLKPIFNLVLYGSVYPKSYYRPNVSDAETIHEIAEAAKRRYYHQHRDASIPSAYLFASMRGAMDLHTFEQLSGTEAGSVRSVRSVHEFTAGDIEMESHGEGFKGSRSDEAKRQDGT
ncbi:hypothetical protein TRIATDRAFT_316718 [Trichoderma atroviride IMI 206040]|uniref:Rhodopsin domain-containing protein n=1 Tax=Hypocrea atroviridis (strain ATCC 20476 / IMI 206040) TaxID=452589 RepID=G9NNP6_HYPAI|nr:uncharacterized protein TRIATDRAFT_316718 [Trichoderma atroviride IMI 206040]EHK47687.1 hypothetical protein TRIATDRAFT_316718 [Trichoderma atroviride IMI 206040]